MLSKQAQAIEEMLLFGNVDIKIDPLMLMREACEEAMGNLLVKGAIDIYDVPKISKLIASSDEENVKLAANLLKAYAKSVDT